MSDPLIPATPFPHHEGEITVMSWTPDEGFFFGAECLVGQKISEVALDDPEPGCLRLGFARGGGAIISVGLDLPEDLEKARHLVLVRGIQ